MSCQNNRSTKPGSKPAKKPGSPGAEVAQHGADDVPPPGPVLRGAPPHAAASDMKLQYLKNTAATCNDGTAAGFYLKEFKGSKRWLIFLEGGWCCYNKETCDSRYKNIPRLMSSADWPRTRKGSGILSSQAEENPHWYNANIVFVPYCSSDVWTPKTERTSHASSHAARARATRREGAARDPHRPGLAA
uniref:Uncharacterized protein n=1 Tax=Electrophorus electricus TaxID=8005 RepID=A0A4W4H955_ELEEL